MAMVGLSLRSRISEDPMVWIIQDEQKRQFGYETSAKDKRLVRLKSLLCLARFIIFFSDDEFLNVRVVLINRHPQPGTQSKDRIILSILQRSCILGVFKIERTGGVSVCITQPS